MAMILNVDWTRPTVTCCLLFAGCDLLNGPGDDGPVQWQITVSAPVTRPAVVESTVIYGAGNGFVYAHDARDGRLKWQRQISTGIVGTNVLGVGRLAIVPQWDLWAMDVRTGDVVWRFAGPDSAAGAHNPAVAGDTVFTVSPFGWVSSVNATDGTAHWSVDLGEAAFEPAVSDELVVYGTRGFLGGPRQGPLGAGHLVALRRADGSEAWRVPLPDVEGFDVSGGALTGGVIWNDLVVVGTVGARSLGVRLTDGSVVWEQVADRPPPDAGYRLSPVRLGNIVVFARQDRLAEGRRPQDGVLLWSARMPIGETPPEAAGSFGYIVSGSIAVFDSTGDVVWGLGGLTLQGGTSFFFPKTAADGSMLTYGRSRGGSQSTLYSIVPPVLN